LRYLREIFDDWVTVAAGAVFLLILAFVVFGTASAFPKEHPFWGIVVYGMVPVLFIVGGIIFILAILRS
jgi:hypothetical protein